MDIVPPEIHRLWKVLTFFEKVGYKQILGKALKFPQYRAELYILETGFGMIYAKLKNKEDPIPIQDVLRIAREEN